MAWGGAHRRDAGLGEPWLRLHHIRDVMVPLLHDIASAGHGLDVQEDAGVADALDVDRGEEVVHVVAVDVARLRNGPNRRALRKIRSSRHILSSVRAGRQTQRRVGAHHAAGGAAGEDDAVEGLEGVRRDHVLQLRVEVVLAAVCAGLLA